MCEPGGEHAATTGLYRAGGELFPSAANSHITYRFPVPAGVRRLHIRFSYEPKILDATLSRSLIQSSLASYIDDPGELRRASDSWESLGPVYNFITLSLDDPAGTFRGNVHRGDPRQEYSIGEDAGTCGYGLVPGPIGPGLWGLTLNVFAVHGEGCRYSLEVRAELRGEPRHG